MKDHAGFGSAWFENHFPEIIGDVTEFHACLGKRSALDQRIPDAGAVGENVNDFFQPNWIFDVVGLARKHLQGAHSAECAVNKKRHVIGFDGAGISRLHDDGRFSAKREAVLSR